MITRSTSLPWALREMSPTTVFAGGDADPLQASGRHRSSPGAVEQPWTAQVESQFRLRVSSYLGTRPLGSFQLEHIRDWVQQLRANGVPGSYARTICANVRAALRQQRTTGTFLGALALPARYGRRLRTRNASRLGRRSGSSRCARTCPTDTKRRPTWAAAVASGRARSWGSYGFPGPVADVLLAHMRQFRRSRSGCCGRSRADRW